MTQSANGKASTNANPLFCIKPPALKTQHDNTWPRPTPMALVRAKSSCARILLPSVKVCMRSFWSQQSKEGAKVGTLHDKDKPLWIQVNPICTHHDRDHDRASGVPHLLDNRGESHDDRLTAHHAEPADAGILHGSRRSVDDDCLHLCGRPRCRRGNPAALRPVIPEAARPNLHDRIPGHRLHAAQPGTQTRGARCTRSQRQKLQVKGTIAFSSSHYSIDFKPSHSELLRLGLLVGWNAIGHQLHVRKNQGVDLFAIMRIRWATISQGFINPSRSSSLRR